MPDSIIGYRVFIASPGGLDKERRTFRDVIHHYNDDEAFQRDLMFRPMGWEDTSAGVGRPQEIINADVQKSDFFVLVLWDRWGSPTGPEPNSEYSSGSKEEFDIAMECYGNSERPMRQVVVMFKAVGEKQLSDQGPELQKVIAFRKQLESDKTLLYETFDTPDRFGELLRKHLGQWKRSHEDGWKNGGRGVVLPEQPEEDGTGKIEEHAEIDDSALTAEAWKLADAGHLTEAEVEFSRSVVSGDHPKSMISYAGFLHRQGRLEQASIFLERAIAVADVQGDERTIAAAYTSWGNVLQTKGNIIGAEEMHRSSLRIAERLQVPEAVADASGNLGNIFRARGDLDNAEEMYQEVLKIEENLGRQESIANAYGNLGIVFATRGDLNVAEDMFRKSLDINVAIDNHEGVASVTGNLANVLRLQGQYEAAEKMYLKSLEMNTQLGRLQGVAIQHGNLGVLYRLQGDLEKSEAMHRKALGIDEQIGQLGGVAVEYASLGQILSDRNDLNGAESMHLKSLEIEQELGRLEGIAKNYWNLGTIAEARRDIDAAEELYSKAIETANRLGSPPLVEEIRTDLEKLRSGANNQA